MLGRGMGLLSLLILPSLALGAKRVPPPEPKPRIPPGDEIVLYLNGGPGSRLEESLDLIPKLQRAGLRRGKRYTVIAFDPPNEGYSSRLDPTNIAPDDKDELGPPARWPLVDFSEQFAADLITALDKLSPIKHRGVYVVGGSLGGCMALRLGRRGGEGWIKKIAAWNPACVWKSYQGSLFKSIALRGGRTRWREDPPSAGPEAPGRRAQYFERAFGPAAPWYLGSVQPNPEEWYRGGRGVRGDWPCKWDRIALARLEQEEVYGQAFRRWHWRLGTELLLFSFFNDGWSTGRDAASSGRPPVYESIDVPTLLMAADDDDWDEGPSRHWENRWSRTNELAGLMKNTPGRAEFFLNTGHSIHNERPELLAETLAGYFSEPGGEKPIRLAAPFEPGPDEACEAGLPSLPPIPAELLESPVSGEKLTRPAKQGGGFEDGSGAGAYGLRLEPALRKLAADGDPIEDLKASAAYLCKGDEVRGRAAADLAVSGRAAYERFRALRPVPGRSDCERRALERAYSAAWALRDPDPRRRKKERALLGWIAVSGEDDPPHRPVNTPSAPYAQYDLDVPSQGRTYRIRCVVVPGGG
jgi:alpha-beta hydrolase superfamily lysophospholipase